MPVPYVRFYTDKWIGGTAFLTDEEEFVFFKICLYTWNTGKFISREDIHTLFKQPPKNLDKIVDRLLNMPNKLRRYSHGKVGNAHARESYATAENYSKVGRENSNKRWKDKKKLDNATASKSDKQNRSSRDSNAIHNSSNRIKNSKRDVDKSVERMNCVDNSIRPTANGIENARVFAEGYDIHNLERRFIEWAPGKNIKNPDAAFVAFVKNHVKNNPL
jgi:E3 ubiquitin-protein ligase DOA10